MSTARDADELHDVLMTAGFITQNESLAISPALVHQLLEARRAVAIDVDESRVYVTVERLPELAPLVPYAMQDLVPASRRRAWTRQDAIVELLRGRVAMVGPTTAAALGRPLALHESGVRAALETLESQGVVLRGMFRPGATGLEWCERTLLARIHRYTLNRLRAEIEPVSPAGYMRFLFDWQHAGPGNRVSGLDGLQQIVRTLDGFELPAAAWEAMVFPVRMDRYDPSWLDMLCLTGLVGWARLSSAQTQTRVVRTTAIALFLREHAGAWTAPPSEIDSAETPVLSTEARLVLHIMATRGALFAHEVGAACAFAPDQVRQSLAELVSAGLAASDGFSGLRGLIGEQAAGPREMSGRWSCLGHQTVTDDLAIETQARVLLRRYGVVCRRVLTREPNVQPWRVLARVYRTLEARGEIRGERFVSGFAGEQFALPEAVERLRELRRTPPDDKVLVISAADPLNLAGIVTAGERVAAIASTRVAYRNGIPLAVLEGDYIRPLADVEPATAADVASALTGRRMPPIVTGFVGRVS